MSYRITYSYRVTGKSKPFKQVSYECASRDELAQVTDEIKRMSLPGDLIELFDGEVRFYKEEL